MALAAITVTSEIENTAPPQWTIGADHSTMILAYLEVLDQGHPGRANNRGSASLIEHFERIKVWAGKIVSP